MRSVPWVWTTGSATPYWLMRFSMIVRIVFMSSARDALVSGRQCAVLAAQATLEVKAEARVDTAPG